MNLGELIQQFRRLTDDNAAGVLWEDDEIIRYANEAERDAAERAYLLEDNGNASAVVGTTTAGVASVTAEVQTITIDAAAGTFTVTYDGQTTAALAFNISAANLQTALEGLSNLVPGNVVVTLLSGVYTLTFANTLGDVPEVIVDDALLTNAIVDIPVVAGKAIYALDARVLKITRAKLDSQKYPLRPTSKGELDLGLFSDWESQRGTPSSFIDQQSTIRLVWTPSAADTLRLTVFRLPLVDMADPEDVPEIRTERHYGLLDGMLARAYLKNDADTYNPAKSAEHEARFTQQFGAKIDANVRLKQRRTRSNTTRINW